MNSGDGDCKLNKVDEAKTQLDAAIRAYKQGEHAVAITLAGAAEEIFGAMCRRKGIRNALERLADSPQMTKISDKRGKRVDYLNDVRNNLKHAKYAKDDVFVSSDVESYVMIARALANASLLEIQYSEIMLTFKHRDFQ
jgi:hypothetical protein